MKNAAFIITLLMVAMLGYPTIDTHAEESESLTCDDINFVFTGNSLFAPGFGQLLFAGQQLIFEITNFTPGEIALRGGVSPASAGDFNNTTLGIGAGNSVVSYTFTEDHDYIFVEVTNLTSDVPPYSIEVSCYDPFATDPTIPTDPDTPTVPDVTNNSSNLCSQNKPILGQIRVEQPLAGYGTASANQSAVVDVFNDANNDGFDTFNILTIITEDGQPIWYGIFLGGCNEIFVDANFVTRIR